MNAGKFIYSLMFGSFLPLVAAPDYQFDFDSLNIDSLSGQNDSSPNTIGNWSTRSSVAKVTAGDLTAQASTNYAFTTIGSGNRIRSSRTDNAYRGQFHQVVPVTGGIVWTSVLLRAQSQSAAAVAFDGSNDSGILGYRLDSRPGFGIRPDSTTGTTELFWNNDLSNFSGATSISLPINYSNQTVLLLARLDLGSNTVTIWLNPTLSDRSSLPSGGDLQTPTSVSSINWFGIGSVDTGVDGYEIEFDNFLISKNPSEDTAFEDVTGLSSTPPLTGNVTADLNGNGIADLAELQYPGISALPPTTDSDGDGQTNAQESFTGTDPFNASSSLRITGFEPSVEPDTGYEFTFTSVPGKRYQVELSPDLTPDSWQNHGVPLTALLDTTTVSIESNNFPDSDHSFIRTRVLSDLDSDSDGLEDELELFLGYGTTNASSVRAASAGGDLQQFINLMTGGNPLGGMAGTNTPGIPSEENASRFLAQASWGARTEDILNLRALGNNAFEKWIEAQISLPPVYTGTYMSYLENRRDSDHALGSSDWRNIPHFFSDQSSFAHFRENLNTAWMRNALFGEDQLRQRTTWSLSQILVIGPRCNSFAKAASGWYDTIHQHAFGNYRDMLYDISIHPWMGWWLSHVGNEKADQVATAPNGDPVYQLPDENFAREIMQLFTIGLWELNMDGTRKLDEEGNPIPTYSNDDITQVARVFTGFTYQAGVFGREIYSRAPMDMIASRHDTGDATAVAVYGMEEKNILGHTLPTYSANPGRTALDDVSDTIDILINHPNTPPFISKNMIQHLVTSNPSPAYVERVANVFANDGTGTRGNLAAVVKAILLDPEARNLALALAPDSGRLKGPMLRITSLARFTNAGSDTPSLHDDTGIQFWLPRKAEMFADLLEFPFESPSVFNFYEPGYSHPGEVRDNDLLSPEFQIMNALTTTTIPNRLLYFIRSGFHSDAWKNAGITPEFEVKMGPLETLAQSTTENLVDELGLIFAHGFVSEVSRNELINRVNFYSNTSNNANERAEIALFLSLVSAEGAVLK